MSETSPPDKWWHHVPNALTLSRFVMAGALFALIEHSRWWACLGTFLLATITDWLDGYLARRWDCGTKLGRILDPLADKVLVCGAYVHLLRVGDDWLYPWMATLILSRELIITTLRSYVEQQGIAFGADLFGKLKMVLQSGALGIIFLSLAIRSPAWDFVRLVGIYLMLFSTLLSGILYLWKASRLLRSRKSTSAPGVSSRDEQK